MSEKEKLELKLQATYRIYELAVIGNMSEKTKKKIFGEIIILRHRLGIL